MVARGAKTSTPMGLEGRRRKPKRDPYVKASPVTITRADGTVEVQEPLSPKELDKLHRSTKRKQ